MGFSFNPLWKLLIDKHKTKEQLRVAIGISPSTIARMGRNENVSMDVLNKICTHLDCALEDIVEYVRDTDK